MNGTVIRDLDKKISGKFLDFIKRSLLGFGLSRLIPLLTVELTGIEDGHILLELGGGSGKVVDTLLWTQFPQEGALRRIRRRMRMRFLCVEND